MNSTIRETIDATGTVNTDDRWHLVLVNHSDGSLIGSYEPIVRPTPIVFGRDDGGFGGLRDDRISRRHAEVSLSGSRAILTDLGSRNGTHLNGRQIDGPETLSRGDVIRLGSVLLLVERADPRRARTEHPELVGQSPAMVDLVERIEKVARRDSTVLLQGETGTGKELVARALHQASGRSGDFCVVNCAGMSDSLVESELFGHQQGAFSGATSQHIGLAESADGGTLFLDEIGDASASLQGSLLRFLQEGEVRRVGSVSPVHVNVRVIAATHRKLPSNSFREDLYSRLARVVIELAPLRERIEDVPLLAREFLKRDPSMADRSPPTLDWRLVDAMLRYTWPRNVRELQGVVERLIIDNIDVLSKDDKKDRGVFRLTGSLGELAEATRADSAKPESRTQGAAKSQMTSRAIRPSDDELKTLLETHAGNVTAVAEHLGAGRNTVYRWMKSAGLELADFR